METIYWLFILILITCVAGFLGNYIAGLQHKATLNTYTEREAGISIQLENVKKEHFIIVQKLDEKITLLEFEKNDLAIDLATKSAENFNFQQKLNEQKTEFEQLNHKFQKEFENLAQKILEEKSEKFTQQNKLNLELVLNPLKEKIKEFESKVDVSHKESISQHASLRQQIIGLTALNEQMSKEATNLTKALKGDNKTQGNWGELILERVLEKSGLEKGREYEVQKSFASEEEGKTRLLPDVVVHLPDHKKMIIDSKVSLTSYEKYVNCEDETEKLVFLKEHIASLNRHVIQLSEKKYEDLYKIESPDFVLLFIPIEPAFAIAINADNQLYNKAFEKNIVIVTPSTLLATLRTIDSMWQNEKQQKNAIEIAQQAGSLYDKFEGLIADLIKVGKKINETQDGYKDAMNKLTEGNGNIVSRIEKLKTMGAKAKKALPQNLLDRASDED